MSTHHAKIAAIQMNSGADVGANLERAAQLIERSRNEGAEFVVLPENFACIPASPVAYQTIAEPRSGGMIQEFLSAQAKRNHVFLLGGTLPIQTSSDKIVSSSILYSPTGDEIACYQKIHLFDIDLGDKKVSHQESAIFAAGKTMCVVDTELGRIGIAVCYDVRFPELFRRMSLQRVDLLALPAAFTQYTGTAHWHILLRARAIENQMYVVAAAQVGTHADGRKTYGHSMIINSWGSIVAELEQGEGVVVDEFNASKQHELRTSFPCLQHRVLQS